MSEGKVPFQVALEQIENVIKFKKCWKCGCNQSAIKSLEKELDKLSHGDRNTIIPLIQKARSTFQPIEYDCLGCKTCFPGDLSNALAQAYPRWRSSEKQEAYPTNISLRRGLGRPLPMAMVCTGDGICL